MVLVASRRGSIAGPNVMLPALYDEAKKSKWTVISMKNDWKRIFAFG